MLGLSAGLLFGDLAQELFDAPAGVVARVVAKLKLGHAPQTEPRTDDRGET